MGCDLPVAAEQDRPLREAALLLLLQPCDAPVVAHTEVRQRVGQPVDAQRERRARQLGLYQLRLGQQRPAHLLVGGVEELPRGAPARGQLEQAALARGAPVVDRRGVGEQRERPARVLREVDGAEALARTPGDHGRDLETRRGRRLVETDLLGRRQVADQRTCVLRRHRQDHGVAAQVLARAQLNAPAVVVHARHRAARAQVGDELGELFRDETRAEEGLERDVAQRGHHQHQELTAGLLRIESQRVVDDRSQARLQLARSQVEAAEVGDAAVVEPVGALGAAWIEQRTEPVEQRAQAPLPQRMPGQGARLGEQVDGQQAATGLGRNRPQGQAGHGVAQPQLLHQSRQHR